MTSLSFRVRELWIDAKAVAAVEFAIVVPFMLLLYVGGVELGQGMAINVKVTATTHSVADMVSQNTQISAARMQTILGASTAIMAPYRTTDSGGHSLVTVTVSEVSTDNGGNATVQWSQSYDGTTVGTGRPVGQAMTLPSSLTGTQNNNISIILGEVSYAYTPNLGYAISGTVTLRDSYYLFPRCSTNSPANSSFPYYDVKFSASTTTCTCTQHLQQKTC
jgi:Flp pilus assembly protein TadG